MGSVQAEVERERLTLTAGRAKKEMPKRAQHEATILPGQVIGTVSPYPTVQSVI